MMVFHSHLMSYSPHSSTHHHGQTLTHALMPLLKMRLVCHLSGPLSIEPLGSTFFETTLITPLSRASFTLLIMAPTSAFLVIGEFLSAAPTCPLLKCILQPSMTQLLPSCQKVGSTVHLQTHHFPIFAPHLSALLCASTLGSSGKSTTFPGPVAPQ